ncbi:hypothetical protein, partial [Pseudanabaena mucicola]|uniref:hypothetical protein n=1 Tax=Pseudanabaena mucicola TaxID=71190 RepID=UPI001A7EC28D
GSISLTVISSDMVILRIFPLVRICVNNSAWLLIGLGIALDWGDHKNVKKIFTSLIYPAKIE